MTMRNMIAIMYHAGSVDKKILRSKYLDSTFARIVTKSKSKLIIGQGKGIILRKQLACV